MKKILLAGAAAVALLVAQPSAHAQFSLGGTIVFDPTQAAHMLEEIGYSTETAANTAAAVAQIVNVYNETIQVYNMANNIWNSVAENVGISGVAGSLNDPYLRNPLPYDTSQHPGYIGGIQDPSGLPYGSQYVTQNTVGGDPNIYNDGSFYGPEIQKRIYSISAAQALATNHMQAAQQRLLGTDGLFSWLDNMNTIQETDSLGSRLKTELNYINTQHVQMQGMLASAQAQKDVFEHNRIQWTYQDEALGIGAACGTVAATGVAITVPACQGAGGGGALSANGTLFTGTPGVTGSGQALAVPGATSPSGFLIPATTTPIDTGGGSPAAFVNPDTGAPLNTGG